MYEPCTYCQYNPESADSSSNSFNGQGSSEQQPITSISITQESIRPPELDVHIPVYPNAALLPQVEVGTNTVHEPHDTITYDDFGSNSLTNQGGSVQQHTLSNGIIQEPVTPPYLADSILNENNLGLLPQPETVENTVYEPQPTPKPYDSGSISLTNQVGGEPQHTLLNSISQESTTPQTLADVNQDPLILFDPFKSPQHQTGSFNNIIPYSDPISPKSQEKNEQQHTLYNSISHESINPQYLEDGKVLNPLTQKGPQYQAGYFNHIIPPYYQPYYQPHYYPMPMWGAFPYYQNAYGYY